MAHRFPVYQIDFQVVESGKVIASSKRKVRWRFGFPNQQALAAGRTGVDCRGEEHDIVLIWSIASGKRQLYMDGKEVHFSTSRAQTFQYSWSAKGNHVIKVVAHASPPVLGEANELYIDGQTFNSMPKSYELGIRGQIPSHARVPGSRGGYGDHGRPRGGVAGPSTRAEEDADLQRAISASLQESRNYLANKGGAPPAISVPGPATQTADLMDLGGASTQPTPVTPSPYTPTSTFGAPPSYDALPPSYGVSSPTYGAPPAGRGRGPNYGLPARYAAPAPAVPTAVPGAIVPSPQSANPYALPSPSGASAYQTPTSQASVAPSVFSAPAPATAAVPTADLFAPAPVDPFAPAPQPVGGYFAPGQPVPPLDDPFAPRPPPPPSKDDIARSIMSAYAAPTTPPAAGGVPPQQPGVPPQPGRPPMQPMPPADPNAARIGYGGPMESEKTLSEMEIAMKKLVNVEHIDEPAEQEYKLTMKAKQEEMLKAKDGRSRGKPPAASGLVGSNATLDHIRSVKPEVAMTGEGVMRAPPQLFHPDAVHAGALVVHGQGPPPIQRGFGIGYGNPPPSYQQPKW